MDYASMIDSRKNVINIFQELKQKFIGGKFRVSELIKYYNYSNDSAKVFIELLGKNGLLNLTMVNNEPVYSFENDKQNQIRNIMLWIKRNEEEIIYFNLAITVIMDEIKEADNKLKLV